MAIHLGVPNECVRTRVFQRLLQKSKAHVLAVTQDTERGSVVRNSDVRWR